MLLQCGIYMVFGRSSGMYKTLIQVAYTITLSSHRNVLDHFFYNHTICVFVLIVPLRVYQRLLYLI